MLKIHHVGIVIESIENTVKLYESKFDCTKVTKVFEMNDLNDEIKFTFLKPSNNGIMIELIEPRRGIWKKRLDEEGTGSICELCFSVNDIGSFYDKMENSNIILEDMQGNPLNKENKKYIYSKATGDKFAYLPKKATQGTLIEIVEQCGTEVKW